MEGTAEIVAFLRHGARSYSTWVSAIAPKAQPKPGPHECSPPTPDACPDLPELQATTKVRKQPGRVYNSLDRPVRIW